MVECIEAETTHEYRYIRPGLMYMLTPCHQESVFEKQFGEEHVL